MRTMRSASHTLSHVSEQATLRRPSMAPEKKRGPTPRVSFLLNYNQGGKSAIPRPVVNLLLFRHHRGLNTLS